MYGSTETGKETGSTQDDTNTVYYAQDYSTKRYGRPGNG